MSDVVPELDVARIAWIDEQHVFFVATAPSGADGHVNLSPKGHDAFRVLDPLRVAYLDLTGSGAETIADLKQNGRITFMGRERKSRGGGHGGRRLLPEPPISAIDPASPVGRQGGGQRRPKVGTELPSGEVPFPLGSKNARSIDGLAAIDG